MRHPHLTRLHVRFVVDQFASRLPRVCHTEMTAAWRSETSTTRCPWRINSGVALGVGCIYAERNFLYIMYSPYTDNNTVLLQYTFLKHCHHLASLMLVVRRLKFFISIC
uniref:Uncharacterized protein n=1 Tax=Pararge aegeria TaxID=116150 RepID=S4PXM4_9NEOP